MVNSFRKSLIYRAAPRWSSAFMRSQPNKSTGPLRGLPSPALIACLERAQANMIVS
jgi:hypothetical protein